MRDIFLVITGVVTQKRPENCRQNGPKIALPKNSIPNCGQIAAAKKLLQKVDWFDTITRLFLMLKSLLQFGRQQPRGTRHVGFRLKALVPPPWLLLLDPELAMVWIQHL